MRLIRAHVAAKPVTTAKGNRWSVRWVVDPGAGRAPRERKRSDFAKKGQAQAFVDNLTEAGLRANGWTLDADGDPVRVDEQAPTVLCAAESYLCARWGIDWQAKQQKKVRGRLQVLVIETLAKPRDRNELRAAFEAQIRSRGSRPEPVTDVEWAGRWLRDIALDPDVATDDLPPRLLDGRRWIEERSIMVSGLDTDTMSRVRRAFVHSKPNTERTYWNCVVAFLNWMVDADMVDRDPTRGLKKVRRDVAGERPEPSSIFTPTEIDLIGERLRPKQNGLWRLWLLLTTFCALRISESLAVTGSMFEFGSNGQLFLNAGSQIDFENGPVDRTEPDLKDAKSIRLRTPRVRRAPVPSSLAAELTEFFGDRIGSPADRTPLFVGPRGAVGSADIVRRWFRGAVRAALGEHHPRGGNTPHDLRHAGATFWFAAGVDQLRVAKWGGWKSLKELLDTYRGVLDALEEDDLDSLDSFHSQWSTPHADRVDDAAKAGLAPAPHHMDHGADVVDITERLRYRAAE